MLHRLAHETAGGRWICTGGGGYALVAVVPRSWAHLLGIASGQPIDPGEPTPAAWRELARRRTGIEPPERMTDGAAADFVPYESGSNPHDAVDRAIIATMKAILPGARAARRCLVRRPAAGGTGRPAAGRKRRLPYLRSSQPR